MKSTCFLTKKALDVKFDLIETCYEYVETIGTGAYGVVCHAKGVDDRIDYAIKKIKNPFMHKVTVIRALREIKILNHFNHYNIVNIVDIFLRDNCNTRDVYVVFNLMESDLHNIISSNTDLSDDHIRFFMYQILCGVNYIHSASVIHRDLKPANILLNSNCLVKITDFGMARLLATSYRTSTNLPAGSPNKNMTQYVMTRWYRAPELLMGQMSYNTKIDLWSCGCILSELYLKTAIFHGDNMILQMKDIIKKMGVPNSSFRSKVLPIVNSLIDGEGIISPTPISELVPLAPKKVIDLLTHLLVYDSEERWSAKQALRHIFFVKYRNTSKETVCESSLDLSFEEEPRSIESLKQILFNQISSSSKHDHLPLLDPPYTASTELECDLKSSDYCQGETEATKSAQSNLSDRTLSAEFDVILGCSLKPYDSTGNQRATNDIPQDSSQRIITVSQFTRNKLISSIKRPKEKIHPKITAVQRQMERKERRLQLTKKRRKVKNKHIISEQLSDWDKLSLKRWEYLSNSKPTQTDINICTEKKNDTNTDLKQLKIKCKTDVVDEMSAEMMSSLSLLDDLDGVLCSNINQDSENLSRRMSDCCLNMEEFLNSLDVDSIDLDLNLLETFSADLCKDNISDGCS